MKGKVGPARMKKSDITFDYLASSQLREEAPKNFESLAKIKCSLCRGMVVGQDPFMGPGALVRSKSSPPVYCQSHAS